MTLQGMEASQAGSGSVPFAAQVGWAWIFLFLKSSTGKVVSVSSFLVLKKQILNWSMNKLILYMFY